MVRIVKGYEKRLEEFLEVGANLFFSRGYEQTSVNDIISKMKVAKGTFYHYFKSKEDLLDKIVEKFSQQSLNKVRKIIKKKGLNAVEKFNDSFIAIGDLKMENIDLMIMLLDVLYKDENLILRYKIFKQNIEFLTPEFAKIIEQGIREGLFSVSDPLEAAELIFTIGRNLNERVVFLLLDVKEKPENISIIERKIEIYEKSLERILGAEEGVLKFSNPSYIEKFKKEYLKKSENG